MIGQRIGNYRIVRLLGEGGMGHVYEAAQEEIGSRVAIKVLRPELCAHGDLAVRLFREAQAVNLIRHPGIPGIFELGHLPDGATYLVMEYLEGESLRARLRRVGRPGSAGLNLMRQVASAMVAAHEANVIHRDLKPDNIMIVPDLEAPGGERAKVLDFGIAKIAGPPADGAAGLHTKTGAVLGTPLYIAPEQCRGLPGVDGQADVYSLGVMLYEVLSGRPPFLSEGIGELMAMHLHEPARPLWEIDPTIPARICALAHAMLAKAPADRPTMAQVAASLVETAHPASMRSAPACGERQVLPRRRSPLPVVMILGAAVLIAGWVTGSHSGGVGPVLAPNPPALPAPAAPQPGPPPAPPASWSLESDPPGAEVLERETGRPLGRTPWHAPMDQEARTVELRLPGYLSEAVVLTRGHERLSIKLRRRRPGGGEETFKNEDIYLPRPKR